MPQVIVACINTFSVAAVLSLPTCLTSPFTFFPNISNRFLLLNRSNGLGSAFTEGFPRGAGRFAFFFTIFHI